MMKTCKNPTCSRLTMRTYCSEVCRWTMRNANRCRQIPDLWVEMDTWWHLVEQAEIASLNVRDYVLNLIEADL